MPGGSQGAELEEAFGRTEGETLIWGVGAGKWSRREHVSTARERRQTKGFSDDGRDAGCDTAGTEVLTGRHLLLPQFPHLDNADQTFPEGASSVYINGGTGPK